MFLVNRENTVMQLVLRARSYSDARSARPRLILSSVVTWQVLPSYCSAERTPRASDLQETLLNSIAR